MKKEDTRKMAKKETDINMARKMAEKTDDKYGEKNGEKNER